MLGECPLFISAAGPTQAEFL